MLSHHQGLFPLCLQDKGQTRPRGRCPPRELSHRQGDHKMRHLGPDAAGRHWRAPDPHGRGCPWGQQESLRTRGKTWPAGESRVDPTQMRTPRGTATKGEALERAVPSSHLPPGVSGDYGATGSMRLKERQREARRQGPLKQWATVGKNDFSPGRWPWAVQRLLGPQASSSLQLTGTPLPEVRGRAADQLRPTAGPEEGVGKTAAPQMRGTRRHPMAGAEKQPCPHTRLGEVRTQQGPAR